MGYYFCKIHRIELRTPQLLWIHLYGKHGKSEPKISNILEWRE